MKARFLAALLLLVVALACERMDRAVDPVWGKEPCAHCSMLVGDRRYAAEAVVSGERRFFDDIGCFVLWAQAHRGGIEHAWVRDADGSGWIEASSANYVHGARTPMDFGYEAHARGDRTTATFEEMRAAVVARRSM